MPISNKNVVLFVTGALRGGGSEQVLLDHLLALDRERFRPEVLALLPEGPNRQRYDEANITVFGPPAGGSEIRRLLAYRRLVRERCERGDVGLVHAWMYYAGFLAPAAARRGGAPSVLVSQRNLGHWLTPLKRRMYRWSNHRHIDFMIVNSDAVQRQVLADGLCPGDRIVVIHNGIDLERFRPPVDPLEERRRLGMPLDVSCIGLVNRLQPLKGQADLLDALEVIDGAGHAPHVFLVGDGPDEENLRRRVANRPWRARVHFMGRRTHVEHIYRALDIAVLCSRLEGFPNVLLESMASALPTVTTPVGGIPEVMEDGREGLFYPVGDGKALGRRLVELLEDEELGRTMGRRARHRVERDFGFDKMQARFEGLYARMMEDAT